MSAVWRKNGHSASHLYALGWKVTSSLFWHFDFKSLKWMQINEWMIFLAQINQKFQNSCLKKRKLKHSVLHVLQNKDHFSPTGELCALCFRPQDDQIQPPPVTGEPQSAPPEMKSTSSGVRVVWRMLGNTTIAENGRQIRGVGFGNTTSRVWWRRILERQIPPPPRDHQHRTY